MYYKKNLFPNFCKISRKKIIVETGTLKVVSTTYLQVRFLNLIESTCHTRKNVLIISLQKLFSFSRKLNFRIFDFLFELKFHKNYILLNNLRSFLMKFGHFMWYFKRNNLIKNSTKTAALKLVPGPFAFAKN